MRKLILVALLVTGCNEQPAQPVQRSSVKVNVDHGRVDIKIKRHYIPRYGEQPNPSQGN